MHPSVSEAKPSAGFSTASLVLGIVGLSTGCCLYSGLICGALAIIFALLARGGTRTIPGRAKVGLGLGIGALTLTLVLFAVAFFYMVAQFGGLNEYLDYYQDVLKQIESGSPYRFY